MVPPITKEDHYQVLKMEPDCIGYCYEIFKLKTGREIGIAEFSTKLQIWVNINFRNPRNPQPIGLTTMCDKIFKYNRQKFA